MFESDNASESLVYDSPSKIRTATMKDRLEQAVKNAEFNLAQAKRAKEILDKHPELEELINIMNNTRF